VNQGITYVGMDAHKQAINVAALYPGRKDAVEWQVVNEAGAVRRMVRKVVREGGEVRFCYEAGVCGYALQRQVEAAGGSDASCVVVAPSLIPRKPGDRIKTDRRDARKLAELLRAGLLTEVCPPTPADEALRDLVRAREDAKEDLTRCRHRLGKLLLRRGLVFTAGKKAWTAAHRRWLKGLRFEHAADQAVLDDYLLAIEQLEERLNGLDSGLAEIAAQAPYATPVGWLRCFRGIDTVTAISLVAELHDFRRFGSARELMAYLGLVPSEYSSGSSTHRGAITKAGNSHVRRLLVEASWHYRHPPRIGALQKRREGQPRSVIAIADRAQQRLHRRYRRLSDRGLPTPKVVTAIARELAGFIWAAMNHAA
jgi:transposase